MLRGVGRSTFTCATPCQAGYVQLKGAAPSSQLPEHDHVQLPANFHLTSDGTSLLPTGCRATKMQVAQPWTV
jgi:hypothetical protein